MNQVCQERRGIRIKPRSRIALALVLALVAALLVCAGVTYAVLAYITTVSQPTSVRIVRIPGNMSNVQIVPLDRTITDVREVCMLYDTVLALSTDDVRACAAKPTPEAYVLTFYRNGQRILTARAVFCPGVSLDRGTPNDTRTFSERYTTPAFWPKLAHGLGMSQSQLEPYLK